jgi:ATP-dependent Lhr-like helicase
MAVSESEVNDALLALETEGVVLRGTFTPTEAGRLDAGPPPVEWCDRTLLARIHRYTLNRLRAEIEPVSPADFMRFLFAWQHVSESHRLTGIDGLRAVMTKLDGFEAAAGVWERAILASRVTDYSAAMLDVLCLTGEVGWARLSAGSNGGGTSPPRGRLRASGYGLQNSAGDERVEAVSSPDDGGRKRLSVVRSSPIALFLREQAETWRSRRLPNGGDAEPLLGDRHGSLSDLARTLFEILQQRGASFARDLAALTCAAPADVREALAELVAAGRVTADGFAGLRNVLAGARAGRRGATLDRSGRWSLVRHEMSREPEGRFEADAAVEMQARILLRRYGVMCRRLLAREPNAAPWRELLMAYRRLEARGEIRGGRFVSGLSGEQFALAQAVAELRTVRRTPANGAVVGISAADPLNLAGIVTAGERIPSIGSTRVFYRDGVPVAVSEGRSIRPLVAMDQDLAASIARATSRRMAAPVESRSLVATA